jgi:hypothetical protein
MIALPTGFFHRPSIRACAFGSRIGGKTDSEASTLNNIRGECPSLQRHSKPKHRNARLLWPSSAALEPQLGRPSVTQMRSNQTCPSYALSVTMNRNSFSRS